MTEIDTNVPEGSAATPLQDSVVEQVLDYEGEVAESGLKKKEHEMAQAVREQLQVTETVDPLDALLKAPVGPTTAEWKCPRLRTTFKIRALNNQEYNAAQDQATRFVRNKRTGRMDKDLDPSALSLLLCSKGSMSPDFNDPKLLAKYRVPQPHQVVAAALLPGEIEKLAEAVLNLSGFAEELDEPAKN